MIYQRHMPREELFSAQLEMLMQNGRLATVNAHLVGVVATVMMFWSFMSVNAILLWAAAFLILLLLRSLQMSNALVERRYQTRPKRVYWQLLIGAALTGGVWSAAYIYITSIAPVTMQYAFLLVIVMIIAFSVGFSVMIREYFVVSVFTSLWPIAWWSLVHYWEQPYNMLIGLVLLAFCALLVYVADQTYKSFRNMISLAWEREHIAQELGDLTGSLRDRNRQLRDARRQLNFTGLKVCLFANCGIYFRKDRLVRTCARKSEHDSGVKCAIGNGNIAHFRDLAQGPVGHR